ncbi:hypothetical protein V7100_28500, partial [Priestia megaterium]|uniref:hypothetical protein n=1 Tax=Priestia megaterium TaxID=1404 RepID=UPI003000095F
FINFLRITTTAVVLSFFGVIFRIVYGQIIGEKDFQLESLIGLFVGFFVSIFFIYCFNDYREKKKHN